MNGESAAVSVVIPTAGGRAALLERSIERLLEDPATQEVIVVIDATDEATERVVEAARERDRRVRRVPGPSLVGGPRNRGQSARIAGAHAASSSVVLALDDDVGPLPGLVSGHLARHLEGADLVVVGYMPVVPVADRRGAMDATARLYSARYERACDRYERSGEAALRLWSGNFSLRREHWLRAVAGDDEYPPYHDDLAFGLRLRDLGIHGVFDRNLVARHWYRRSARELLDDAIGSGVGMARVRALHPEFRPAERPSPTRPTPPFMLAAAKSRLGCAALGRGIAVSAAVASRIGARSSADAAVRALWSVGVARGSRLEREVGR